jgi:hypothetical protein
VLPLDLLHVALDLVNAVPDLLHLTHNSTLRTSLVDPECFFTNPDPAPDQIFQMGSYPDPDIKQHTWLEHVEDPSGYEYCWIQDPDRYLFAVFRIRIH